MRISPFVDFGKIRKTTNRDIGGSRTFVITLELSLFPEYICKKIYCINLNEKGFVVKNYSTDDNLDS